MTGSGKPKIVALAGNPNVGKSTLFNALTGLHQHTGNWPGKTVMLAEGTVQTGDAAIKVVDLPGTYSLNGFAEDEQIAAAYLDSGAADRVVAVCDGGCLERNLILVLQIMKKTPNVVVCINLMDEAECRGIQVDGDKLAQLLGVPVVLTAARSGTGVDDVKYWLTASFQPEKCAYLQMDAVAAAETLAAQCVQKTQPEQQNWRRVLDHVLVSRRYGIPILLMLLLLMVWLTVWGANYPSMLLEGLIQRGYAILYRWMESWPWWLRGVLLDGIYATAGQVLAVMLPPMAIFFPLFTVLEDIGYLPRMAFLLDRPMCRCGGCGKQALTLCMGLGCNAVGVTGCRIVDSPRERLMAILTNAMVPCNGRFPTLILLSSIFFSGPVAAVVVAGCIALGVLGAMGISGILSKTVLRHEESTFLMEIPPLRRPRFGQILVRSLLDRTFFVAGRAMSVAAPAGMVLWILGNTELLNLFSSALDPIGKMLGMNGIILLAFLLALPANELVIPVMLMTITGSGNLHDVQATGAAALLASSLSREAAICTMIFTLFHWPCSTTLLTIYRETGSAAKTAAGFFLPTAVGVILCFVLQLFFRYFCA